MKYTFLAINMYDIRIRNIVYHFQINSDNIDIYKRTLQMNPSLESQFTVSD